MVKRFIIALVLVVIVCGGLVGFNMFRSKMITEFFANMQKPAVAISTTEVKPISWTPEIDAIGTLWANQGIDLATQTAGIVKSIEFDANDRVVKDQLLVQLDDSVERADLLSAEAALARDRSQLERAQRLRATGVSSEASLQDAQSAFASSESNLARIKAILDQKAIEAPFTGTIGIPRIDVGEYLQVGAVLATLQELDTMKVNFTVPEQQMGELKLGQHASFGLTDDAFPFSGRVTGIDPKIDPESRLVSVRAEVENPNNELRPGQFVRIRVQLPTQDNVIAVPQTSVVTSLYGDYVYLVENADAAAAPKSDDDKPAAQADQSTGDTEKDEKLVAKQTFVEIGRRQGTMVEITKGVKAGDTVVTSGQNKLTNNAPVKVNNKVNPATVALGEGEKAQ